VFPAPAAAAAAAVSCCWCFQLLSQAGDGVGARNTAFHAEFTERQDVPKNVAGPVHRFIEKYSITNSSNTKQFVWLRSAGVSCVCADLHACMICHNAVAVQNFTLLSCVVLSFYVVICATFKPVPIMCA
jgi:hypothetical protein